ncbi:MAG: hypothetical protein AB7Q04_13695 [Steroidobacteraceae bacterium]
MKTKTKLPRLPKGWVKPKHYPLSLMTTTDEHYYIQAGTAGKLGVFITVCNTVIHMPPSVARHFHAMLGEAIRKAEDNG